MLKKKKRTWLKRILALALAVTCVGVNLTGFGVNAEGVATGGETQSDWIKTTSEGATVKKVAIGEPLWSDNKTIKFTSLPSELLSQQYVCGKEAAGVNVTFNKTVGYLYVLTKSNNKPCVDYLVGKRFKKLDIPEWSFFDPQVGTCVYERRVAKNESYEIPAGGIVIASEAQRDLTVNGVTVSNAEIADVEFINAGAGTCPLTGLNQNVFSDDTDTFTNLPYWLAGKNYLLGSSKNNNSIKVTKDGTLYMLVGAIEPDATTWTTGNGFTKVEPEKVISIANSEYALYSKDVVVDEQITWNGKAIPLFCRKYTVTQYFKNLQGDPIERDPVSTDIISGDTFTGVAPYIVNGYRVMGYYKDTEKALQASEKVVISNVTEDHTVTFVYAQQRDLNNDSMVDDTDLGILRRSLVGKMTLDYYGATKIATDHPNQNEDDAVSAASTSANAALTIDGKDVGSLENGGDQYYVEAQLNLPSSVAKMKNVAVETTVKFEGGANVNHWWRRFGIKMTANDGVGVKYYDDIKAFELYGNPNAIFADEVFNDYTQYKGVVDTALKGNGLKLRVVRMDTQIIQYAYLDGAWVRFTPKAVTCNTDADTDIRFLVCGGKWTFSNTSTYVLPYGATTTKTYSYIDSTTTVDDDRVGFVDFSTLSDPDHALTLNGGGTGTDVDGSTKYYVEAQLNLPDSVKKSRNVILETTLRFNQSEYKGIGWALRFGIKMTEYKGEYKGIGSAVIGKSEVDDGQGNKVVKDLMQVYELGTEPGDIFKGYSVEYDKYYGPVVNAIVGKGLKLRVVRIGTQIIQYAYLDGNWVEFGPVVKCDANADTDIRFLVCDGSWKFCDTSWTIVDEGNIVFPTGADPTSSDEYGYSREYYLNTTQDDHALEMKVWEEATKIDTKNSMEARLTLPPSVTNSKNVTLETTVKFKEGIVGKWSHRFGIKMTEKKGVGTTVLEAETTNYVDKQNVPGLQVFELYGSESKKVFDGYSDNRSDYEEVKEALNGDGLKLRVVRMDTQIIQYAYLNGTWKQLGPVVKCDTNEATDIRFLILEGYWRFEDISVIVRGHGVQNIYEKELADMNRLYNMSAAKINDDNDVDCRDIVDFKLKQFEEKKPKVYILGDSYSTFSGYLPEGNESWYCETGAVDKTKSSDIRNVNQTWWYKLIKEKDLYLVKNNSWSGSAICNTGWNNPNLRQNSFIRRFERDIKAGYFDTNPVDYVIIFGGTNDSWAIGDKQPGTGLGTIQWDSFTSEDLNFTLPAFCKLLQDVREALPYAKIITVINTEELSPELTEGMKTASNYSEKVGDVTCVELNNINRDYGHPTIAGMQAIAEQIAAQMPQ